MNISRLPKIFALYLLVGVIPFLAVFDAQGQTGGVEFHSMEVVIGDTLYFDFYSDPPYVPQLDQYGVYPVFGIADLPGNGPLGVKGWNTLSYVPTTTDPVIDTIYVQYWKFENNMYFTVNLTIEVTVTPSIIHALDDYAETVQDQPVSIPVLNNDWGNGDTIKVEDVPLVNHGSIALNPDSTLVTFTPSAGFVGLAHFNYTICDEDGTCDMATVTISVMSIEPPVFDTLRLTTPKDTPREILLPLDGYSLDSAPTNGWLDSTSNSYIVYHPNPGFFDDYDYFTYSKSGPAGTQQIDVIMHVLDIDAGNLFVKDDYASTPIGQSVEIDALSNDLGGEHLQSVAIVLQPPHGSAVNLGGGIFEYTPDPGFSGLDQFVYRAISPNGAILEYGTVHVTVSNQVPAQGTFTLSTPKNVPLVIAYNVPIYDYNFTIITEPEAGVVAFYPGFQTLDLNGQTFAGFNMLIYTPDQGVADFQDEFEIEYCVVSDNCPTANVKVKVDILDIDVAADQYCLGENCVWAGDTNNDGVVDMKDILPVGLCMGEVGHTRPNPDLSLWFGQYGDDWNSLTENPGFDLKHIDADGNGIIGGSDTTAISQFYLNQHSILPQSAGSSINVPLYFYEEAVSPVTGGDLVLLDLWLGDPNDQLAEDIYGFTFTMEYESDVVDPASVHINFLDESWMSYNSPVMHMTKKPFDGRIDAGFTRTSGYSENGYGVVAAMEFIIVDDIDGIRPRDQFIELKLNNITAMNSAGQTFSLPGSTIKIPIRTAEEEQPELSENDLKVFPNPAENYVNLYLNGADKTIEEVKVFKLTGEMLQTHNSLLQKHVLIDTHSLPTGLYLAQVIANDGTVLTKKFEVVR